jgi:hypothetical protein
MNNHQVSRVIGNAKAQQLDDGISRITIELPTADYNEFIEWLLAQRPCEPECEVCERMHDSDHAAHMAALEAMFTD